MSEAASKSASANSVKIVCFRCGKGMGDIDVDLTDEIKVWYGMHKDCEIVAMFQPDWYFFIEHVKRQNELPRKGDAGVASSV